MLDQHCISCAKIGGCTAVGFEVCFMHSSLPRESWGVVSGNEEIHRSHHAIEHAHLPRSIFVKTTEGNASIPKRGKMMTKRAITVIVTVAALGSAVFSVWQTPAFSEQPAVSTTSKSNQSEQLSTLPSDPWQTNQLMNPEELVKTQSEAVGEKPLVLYVGYPLLYHGGHIAGSKFAGPASKPDGLQKLTQAAEGLPRDEQIVLYCGCCPWKECPNIRPAVRTMKELGFKNVRVLYLPKNLRQDWIDKGFPIQKADDAK